MQWNNLTQTSELETVVNQSFTQPIVLFKHSTRCSISSMAKARLEREDNWESASFYYIDLLKNRDLSNAIAKNFDVHHESPQIILIRNGECVYDASHNAIMVGELKEQLLRYSS